MEDFIDEADLKKILSELLEGDTYYQTISDDMVLTYDVARTWTSLFCTGSYVGDGKLV